MTKFKPGDKVFYIAFSPDRTLVSCKVVCDIDAKKLYTGRSGWPDLSEINAISKERYNCVAVFISSHSNNSCSGWMPENSLYFDTEAARILYKKT